MTKRPKLVLLTQWFDPEPTFKGLAFAKAMRDRGFDVEVVTGFPNYPGGKLYAGYKIRPMLRVTIDDINIVRLALYPSHSGNRFARALNYLSFCFSATAYLTLVQRRAEILYAYHPPLTVGIAAVIARFFRRTPTVIDIQDVWPDTIVATGMIKDGILLGLLGKLCDWVYRHVDHIAVLSPGFKRLLARRGVPDSEMSVIYNWAAESGSGLGEPHASAAMSASGKFKILFAGNMGPAQGLDCVLDAAKRIAVLSDQVQLFLLGGGVDVERLKLRVTKEGIRNVVFLPRVPIADVGAYLAASDCLLVNLRSDPLFLVTIPSKTQAYLAAGKPIIMAVEGDAADLITQAGAGIVVSPGDSDALADAILRMAKTPKEQLEQFGMAGAAYYAQRLSIDAGADAFAAIFNRLRAHANVSVAEAAAS
jgi:colanic acid biosynthesis glycosyl transferase WcaI